MFGNIKDLAKLPQMLAQAKAAQEKMREMQEDMKTRVFTGLDDDGLVAATVSGTLEVREIDIRSDALDRAATQAAVVAACQAAQRQAQAAIQHEMRKLADEAGLPTDALPEA